MTALYFDFLKKHVHINFSTLSYVNFVEYLLKQFCFPDKCILSRTYIELQNIMYIRYLVSILSVMLLQLNIINYIEFIDCD